MAHSSTTQIFLDCDGVLADFDALAAEILGMHPRAYEDRYGSDRFWDNLRDHREFYRKLPLLADARELFEGVAHLTPVILTGCPRGGWAEAQKVAWAKEHFPGTRMITCASRDKSSYMKPGDVLVDDYLKYRQLWEDAGGVFIHHTSAKASLEALRARGIL